MRDAHTGELPDLHVLEAGLSVVLTGEPVGASVIARAENVYASTSSSEVVRCRVPDGSERRLFCKYLSRATSTVDGRAIEPMYEVDVYRHVLDQAVGHGPDYYGYWEEPGTRRAWLIIDYVDGGRRLMHVAGRHQVRAMEAAATWIGSFHRLTRERLQDGRLTFLRRLDEEHHRRRLERMVSTLGEATLRDRRLQAIRQHHDHVVDLLVGAPHAVVHGEFYPKNILFRDGSIYPVDWETASVGPGVLDLASLTEDWSPHIVSRCQRAYLAACHPDGVPADFERALIAARLQWHVHWLGHAPRADRPKWSRSTTGDWRLEQLRRLGEQLGLCEDDA